MTATAATATVAAHLVGPNGRTLYVKFPPGCSGECYSIWPPFTVGQSDALVADYPKETTIGGKSVPTCGLTAVGISAGRFQVAACANLLYYYIGDTAPGQTKGDGFGGFWRVAALAF